MMADREAAPARTDDVLSGPARERAEHLAQELIQRTSTRADQGLNSLRLLIALLFLVGWPLAAWPDLSAGVLRAWMVWISSAVAVGLSLTFAVFYRRHQASVRSLLISVFLDIVLVSAAVAPLVLWPGPHFGGATRMPGTYLLLYAVVVAGIRLSQRVLWLGTVLGSGIALALVTLDTLRDLQRPSLFSDLLVFVVLLAASVSLAFWICKRTRTLVLDGTTSAVRAERTRMLLGAYADEDIAAHVMAEQRVALGGEHRVVAVLFSDLRGFTTYAEKLDPRDLVTQINHYMGDMVAVIKREGGTIDKFIGDAIMAVFGAPISRGQDAGRAIRAARGMMQALALHNEARARQGLPPLAHGIGVHHGPVVAGNLGTEGRANYTVVGDTVNLASRLESMNKQLGTHVLISEAAVQAAGADAGPLREVSTVQVRGRDEPVRVFTLETPEQESPSTDAAAG